MKAATSKQTKNNNMFNFQLILAQITGLLQGLLVSVVPDAASLAKEFLEGHKTRLWIIERGAVDGDLNAEDVKQALKAEADILLSELRTFSQIGGQLVQDSFNQVQDIIVGILQPND